MTNNKIFDVIIVGGSYSGLAAGMALARALKQVLVIDSGKPCNRQTPHSHNFITQDGKAPFKKRLFREFFACGDNTTRMHTVASAVAMGTAAGMMTNKEIVLEEF